jgi:hypothetical protein
VAEAKAALETAVELLKKLNHPDTMAFADDLQEGSMAEVYRAEGRVRGCLVAAKVMKPHRLSDQVALERFRHEAESP